MVISGSFLGRLKLMCLMVRFMKRSDVFEGRMRLGVFKSDSLPFR